MFLELDPIIVAYILNGSKVDYNSRIEFFPTKNVKVSLHFEIHQKRLGISVYDSQQRDHQEHVRKKSGVSKPNKCHIYGCDYDFKYSTKNCERIISVITELLIYFDEYEVK